MKPESSVIRLVIWAAGLLWLLLAIQVCAQTSTVTGSGLAKLQQTVLFRDGDIDLSFGQAVSGLVVKSNGPGWTWTAGISRVTPTGRLSHGKTGKNSISIFAERSHWLTRAELRAPLNRVRLGSFRRIRRYGPDDYGASMDLQPSWRIGFGATFAHRNWRSSGAEFHAMGEGGKVHLNAPSNMFELSLQVQLHDGVMLAASASEMSLTPREDLKGREEFRYQVAAEGVVKQSKITLVKSFDPITDFSIGYYSLTAKTSMESFADGRRFGHFGIVDGEVKTWDARLIRGRQEYGIQFGVFDGEIAGTVKAWPFVSNFLRFLGERRHFRGKVDGDFKRAWFERAASDKGKSGFGFRVEYYQINPHATWVSWRPLLFGFGADDLRRDQINIRQAHLMQIQISPAFRLRQLFVQMVASQWVPLSIEKIPPDDAANDSDPLGSSSNSKGYQHSGFSLGISLRLDIGRGSK